MQVVWISDPHIRECSAHVYFARERERFIQKLPNFISHDWRNLHSN